MPFWRVLMAMLMGTVVLVRMGMLVKIWGTVVVNVGMRMEGIFPEHDIKCPKPNDHQDQAHKLFAVG